MKFQTKEEHQAAIEKCKGRVDTADEHIFDSWGDFRRSASGFNALRVKQACGMVSEAHLEMADLMALIPREYTPEKKESPTAGTPKHERLMYPPETTRFSNGCPSHYPIGVPNAYPISIPLPPKDSLVPRMGFLYDTEVIINGTERLTFFIRPLGGIFGGSVEQKSKFDTNLQQSAMLAYPNEFEIEGIGFAIDDKDPVIVGARAELTKNGSRHIWSGTFNRTSCSGMSLRHCLNANEHNRDSLVHFPLQFFRTCLDGGDKKLLHLLPGYCFNVDIKWDKPVVLSKPVKMMVALYGKWWEPKCS